MSKANNLSDRLKEEFSSWDKKIQQLRETSVEELQSHEKRLEQFAKQLDELKEIWRPKLETLAKQFGDKVKVTPTIEPSRREARFTVQSDLARMTLRFWVTTDADVKHCIFNYDLEINPTLMDFESKSQISFALNKVDRAALEKWLDDRVVAFVKTYFALYQNDHYLKDHMVEDPVLHVRFPKFVAGATLKQNNKTIYFIAEETRDAFEKKQKK